MPDSVWDAEVQSALDQAYESGVKLVYVGNRNVEVLTPFPSPIDWRDTWIYFMMVDRFNNPATPPRHQPWDQPWGDFQGGTFEGIKQQLDYLQELGVGALWRDEDGNPDPAWSESPPTPPLNAAVWPRELQGNRFFKRQGNAFVGSQIIPEGDFYSLKAMVTDYQTPEGMIVFQTLVRAFNYLIAKYDVDGFRIDTLMYLDPVFARNFANAIREFAQSIGKKNFFTFGEIWGTEEQIAHFIGRNALAEGEPIGVDAALDYPLFYKLPAVVKGQLAPSELHSMYEYRKQVESGVLSTHGDTTGLDRSLLTRQSTRLGSSFGSSSATRISLRHWVL